MDPKLDRATGTLAVVGFWLEDSATGKDPVFAEALGAGLIRFATFVAAKRLDLSTIPPVALRQHLDQMVHAHGATTWQLVRGPDVDPADGADRSGR